MKLRDEFNQSAPPIIQAFYDYEMAGASAMTLVDQGVTGIITGSDFQALGTIRTLQTAGLSVPQDVSVIGFDDSFIMAHLDPALTTLRQPVVTISRSEQRQQQPQPHPTQTGHAPRQPGNQQVGRQELKRS